MVIRLAATDLGAKDFDRVWSMNEQSTQREVARGKTGIVFFDYATRKVTPMPDVFRELIVSLPAIAKPFPDRFK